jgi:hypothetical protein
MLLPTGPTLRAAALMIFTLTAAASADEAAVGHVKNVSGPAEIIHAGESQSMALVRRSLVRVLLKVPGAGSYLPHLRMSGNDMRGLL